MQLGKWMRLPTTGDSLDDAERENLISVFGSVEVAMLNLFKSSTGGADWEVFYSVISPCLMSACMFVFFIAFMQVALMSIFTGIFVEKAMKLAPPDANVLSYMPKYLRIGPCELPKLPNGMPDLKALRRWRPSVKARPSWTLGQQTRPPKECLH